MDRDTSKTSLYTQDSSMLFAKFEAQNHEQRAELKAEEILGPDLEWLCLNKHMVIVVVVQLPSRV